VKEETKQYIRQIYKQLGDASTIGLALALSIVIGLGIGYYLDKWFHTEPYLLIIFLILGVIAGFRNVYIIGKRIQKRM